MVGHKLTHSDHGSSLRKLRKPLIEKRRRERINTSIDQLKKFVICHRPEFDGETKLDKAEILELTVNHLTTEQRRSANSDRYNQGFNDCTRETIQFLITNGILDAVSLSRLQGHLDSICRQTTTHRPSVTVPMETNQHLLSQRLCSTPQSYVSVPQFSCDISMTTSSSSSLSDFKLSSSSNCEDSLYGASSGSLSENYVLGNIICDEKPWRPW